MIERRPRVLLVDDEAPVRELIATYLADAYEVVEADRAARGIELARGAAFDAVLLDVMMPEMNGFDACRAIRAAAGEEELPVFLVTALDGVDDRVHALACGATDLLSKPVDRRELVLRLERALAAREREAGFRRLAAASERARAHAHESLARLLIDLRSAVAEVAGAAALGPAVATEALEELGAALDDLIEVDAGADASLAEVAREAASAVEEGIARVVVETDSRVAHPGRVRHAIARLVGRAVAASGAPVVLRVTRRDGAPAVAVVAPPTTGTTRRRRTARLNLDLLKLAADVLGATVVTAEGSTELVLPRERPL